MAIPIRSGIIGDGETVVVNGALKVDNSAVTQPISGAVSVSGTVGVNNFPATQPVSGTFFQATQPVSGTVGVNNFPATQPVSGTVGVNNFPATQPVSGTFFQATQPVSGTVGVNNFPATQPVSGTFFQATQPIRGASLAAYAAATATFTPAAGDIFVLTGSATKTIKLLRLILSGTATTAASINTLSLIKRSAADTGGTAAATTRVPLDSADAAASAIAQHYTVAPTPGAAVGTLWAPRVTVPAAATVFTAGKSGAATILDLDLSEMLNGRLPTLRGAAETLALNLSVLPTGATSFQVTAFWTEE